MSNFEAIVPALAKALEKRGYSELTPVQKAVLEPQHAEADAAGLGPDRLRQDRRLRPGAIAPTLLQGSTASSASAACGRRRRWRWWWRRRANWRCRSTRELDWLYAMTRRHAWCPASAAWTCAPNGVRWNAGAHIVVGTPGRLRDHIERGALDISQLRAVVLDEADEMLDLGFREDLEFILDAAPAERRTLMFSATVAKLDRHSWRSAYQKDAIRIATAQEKKQHVDIEYRVLQRGAADRENAIINLLRHMQPRSTLVFCDTRMARESSHRAAVEPRLRGGGAVGRAEPVRAHPCPAGDARRPGARLRRHRRGRPRHRPAGPGTGGACRSADQCRDAAASLGPHRPCRAARASAR